MKELINGIVSIVLILSMCTIIGIVIYQTATCEFFDIIDRIFFVSIELALICLIALGMLMAHKGND